MFKIFLKKYVINFLCNLLNMIYLKKNNTHSLILKYFCYLIFQFLRALKVRISLIFQKIKIYKSINYTVQVQTNFNTFVRIIQN